MPQPKETQRSVRAERALLAALVPGRGSLESDPFREIRALAEAAGANVVGTALQRRDHPVPGTAFGRGKIEEMAAKVADLDADLVLVDNDLTPAQVRNLETAISRKVVDRTELILDIFATRARSLQAKLQVELAQLEYTLPRLRRMWTHLSRIEGGIGTRGPGETQIESDRRAANRRIRDLKRRIAEIQERRHRTVEARRDAFTASLVGYTNAGKSTLMNRLTGAGVSVRDRLFETLDTRTRSWDLPGGRQVLLSDTVGFIRNLPHHLVASFHATLEETLTADLLIHVADLSASDLAEQMEAVDRVLGEIGAGCRPVLAVFNKADLPHNPLEAETLKRHGDDAVVVSAATGQGVELLCERLERLLEREMVEVEFDLPPGSGAVEAAVARFGRVLSADYSESGVRLKALLHRSAVEAVRKRIADGR